MGSRGAGMSLVKKIGCATVGIGVASSILSSSMYIVRGGEGAVVVDRFRGVMDEAVEEGAHLLIPWRQKSFVFDIRMRPHTLSSEFRTKDLKLVKLTLRLLSHPDVSRLPHIYKTIGIQYDAALLLSFLQTEIQYVVSQFEVVQLANNRVRFFDLLHDRLLLRMRADDLNIVLDELCIIHVDFIDY